MHLVLFFRRVWEKVGEKKRKILKAISCTHSVCVLMGAHRTVKLNGASLKMMFFLSLSLLLSSLFPCLSFSLSPRIRNKCVLILFLWTYTESLILFFSLKKTLRLANFFFTHCITHTDIFFSLVKERRSAKTKLHTKSVYTSNDVFMVWASLPVCNFLTTPHSTRPLIKVNDFWPLTLASLSLLLSSLSLSLSSSSVFSLDES